MAARAFFFSSAHLPWLNYTHTKTREQGNRICDIYIFLASAGFIAIRLEVSEICWGLSFGKVSAWMISIS